LIILFLLTCYSVRAQNKIQVSIGSGSIINDFNYDLINSKSTVEKGYLGISPELSLQIGVTSVGFRMNIDAGYKISRVLGVEVLFLGGVYETKTYDGTGPYRMNISVKKEATKYRGLLVGPLFSITLGEKTYWNIAPMIGKSWFYPQYYYEDESSSIAFDLNTNLFFHTGPRMAFRASADCFITDEILTVNFGLGLMYRFIK